MTKQDELEDAMRNNNIKKVELLLKNKDVDPSINDNQAIIYASSVGYIILDIIKLLLNDPRVDPSENNNQAIKAASENGYTNVVKLLLQHPRVDPSSNNNYAINHAAYQGHFDVVKLLLKDERVKEKLQEDFIELYNDLIKKDAKNKIEEF